VVLVCVLAVALILSLRTTPTAQAAGPVDGITCGSEVVTSHVHAHLALYDHGKPVILPSQIGIPVSQQIPPSSDGGVHSCLYWLHTHDISGVVHMESPRPVTFTLGQFLDIWTRTATIDSQGGLGMALDNSFALALARTPAAELHIDVNSKPYRGAYRALPLGPHDQITLEIGNPQVSPPPFTFPAGD
jgi:hypothetical protein